jgi:predicted nucleic acid-binding protein
MSDATIAGIAEAQDLVVMTDNTKHFQVFGIAVASPDEI